jgi:radical SAM-linked protein
VYVLSRVRLKYTREEPVKYISHLDLLRTFNRAIKRAGIPIVYSQGFNPHPIISFGLPLPVGVTSESEYMDIELEADMDPQNIIEQLNKALPGGIRITKAVQLGDRADKIASVIALADYRVMVDLKKRMNVSFSEQINKLLESDEILIEKQGKKDVKLVNIRKDIHHLRVEQENGDHIVLGMRLSAGSSSNLKPELVVQALEKYIPDFEVDFVKIHRMRLLLENGLEI